MYFQRSGNGHGGAMGAYLERITLFNDLLRHPSVN